MPHFTYHRSRRIAGASLVALLALASLLLVTSSATSSTTAVVPTVGLGAAGSFAILSATGVTDAGAATTIKGNVGASPITGAAIGLACSQVTGRIYATDAFGPAPCSIQPPSILTTAKNDSNTAWVNASGRPGGTPVVANQLAGLTLGPGVYTFGHGAVDNLTAGDTLTLSGSASSVWIFQATSDFVIGAGSEVRLAGGAQACHVFWSVASDATLNTTSTLVGTVLAADSIFVLNGVHVHGRLLAQTAAVTLDHDTFTRSDCADTSGPPSSGGSGSEASREIYCDPITGQTYNLIVGQDKQPPYDQLNLVPATVDPVTGAKSCSVPAAATVTATTTTATTTTTTTTTPTTTTPAHKPRSKSTPKTTPVKSAVAAAAKVRAAKAAPRPQPAKHAFGVTG